MNTMPGKDKKTYSNPLDTKQMRTTGDGEWILVNGARFKRTVLPSSAVKRPVHDETEKLLDELDEQG